MAGRAVRVDRSALAEAEDASLWYASRSPTSRIEFVAELDRSIALIVEAPNRWPTYEAGTRRLVMQRFPFAIVYRVLPDLIQIVAVAHTSRRPGYWLR